MRNVKSGRTQSTLQYTIYCTSAIVELSRRPLDSGHPRLLGVSWASKRVKLEGVDVGVGVSTCIEAVAALLVGLPLQLVARVSTFFDSIAFPTNPPMSPDMIAMMSALMRRNGQRAQRFCGGGSDECTISLYDRGPSIGVSTT
jgi:hypothetical protein